MANHCDQIWTCRYNRYWFSVVSYISDSHLIMYQTILNIFLYCKVLVNLMIIKAPYNWISNNSSEHTILFLFGGFTHHFIFIVIYHELTPWNLNTIQPFCIVWSPGNETNKLCLCRIPEPKIRYRHTPLGQKKSIYKIDLRLQTEVWNENQNSQ